VFAHADQSHERGQVQELPLCIYRGDDRLQRCVCTECGMGRAGREEIPALLDLHRQIVAAG